MALVTLAVLTGCAAAQLHRAGLADIDHGRYEEGLQKLEQAAENDPGDLTYRVDVQARREAIVQDLVGAGDKARSEGNLAEAEQNFHRALNIAPGNERARLGLDGVDADRHHAAIVATAQHEFDAGRLDDAETKLRAVLAEDPAFRPATDLRAKIDTARGPVNVTPRLRGNQARTVTLEFRDAPTKMVFEVLSRQTGINFVFDKEVRTDSKTSIFVRNVPVEQAVELVLGQNQLARQVLSENMVLIYPNTTAKQKEYQDQIVKSFYLTNADPKKAQELLKTVLNAKTLFVDDKANLLVIRDTPETVRMAEKLIASLDMAEPEVMMEVEVLEISRSKMDQLGIAYPTSATVSLNPVTGTAFTLRDFAKQDGSTMTVTKLSATANFMKQVGVANTLASPRIRARSREKAKILIGSRVPVVTNSVTPTAGGTSVVTGNVQYLDVGLTLEVEPTVHLDGEVAIKVNLEVSSIIKEVNVGTSGTLAYQIGTRNTQTLLSLQDGETQILAGLIQDSDTRNSAHIPGLGDIPIVGRLFGTRSTNKEKSEIVLSITPRIIRSATRPPSETTEFWYGTESNIRGAPLAPGGGSSPADAGPRSAVPAPANAPVSMSAPAASAPNTGVVGGAAATETPAADAAPQAEAAAGDSGGDPAGNAAAPATVTLEPTAQASAAAVSAAGPPSASWEAPPQVRVGEDFTVTLALASNEPLVRVRSQARYNPAVLNLVGAEVGTVVPNSLQDASKPRINSRVGNVQMMVVGSKESPVQGSGNLLVLHFRALAASDSTPISLQLTASNGDGRDAGVTVPRPLPVTVNP